MARKDSTLSLIPDRFLERRGAGALVASACLLLGILGAGTLTFAPGVSVAMQDAANQLGEFLARSPGERRDADLIKGKKGGKGSDAAPQLAAVDAPEDEVLSRVIEPLTEDDETGAPIAEDTPVIAMADINDAAGDGASNAPLFRQVGSGSSLGGLFPIGVGGGGGSGGGGPIGGGGGGPIGGGGGDGGGGGSPPVPAVPEPESWIMMILGMAMCGAALRRRNKLAKLGALS